MKFKYLCAAFCVLATATTQTAFAADESEADDSGWYIGGNFGQSRAHVNAHKIATDVMAPGYSSTYLDHNTIDSGYKLYGGYQINQYISIESGYFDLGEHQFHSITQPDGVLTNNMKFRGINADVVGYLPFTEKFSAFARLGVNYALTQDTFTGAGAANALAGKLHDRHAFGKAGVGLQYEFSESLAMRIESERYRLSNALTDHNTVDLFSVGVVYRFGAHKKTVPTTAVASVPTVATPPAPRFEKVTISATELFNFDSSDVSAAQPELEKLTTTLKGSAEPKRINIVGYTDRLGSEEYNQKLAERRALAVKTYMIDKGVEAERLATEGKGEKDPLVQCDDTNREKLIECLQPNRRVQIDQIEIEREVKP